MASNAFIESAASLAGQVAAGLVKVGIALKNQSRRVAGRHRVSLTQSQILTFLRARPGQIVTLSAIAEWLAITPATASEAVQKLKSKGLLRKIRSDSDARTVRITLSPKGWQKTKNVQAHNDAMVAALDSLNSAEQAVFLRALLKMVRALQEQGEIPASRMCTTCDYLRIHLHADGAQSYHCGFFDTSFEERLLRIDCDQHRSAEKTLLSTWIHGSGEHAARTNGERS